MLSSSQIHQILTKVVNVGFRFKKNTEISLEVNPGTLLSKKCRELKDIGINRISIGCQSFRDSHLKACNREHSVQQTLDTIDLVKQHFENYSLDLLFALPGQSLSHLKEDLEVLKTLDPPHISAYCLTLKKEHPMNRNRCSEEKQVEMFSMVFHFLQKMGLEHYEISNFAKPGFQSQHNLLYWTDQDYWGLGLGAHSYKKDPDFGFRFWNKRSYQDYMKQVNCLKAQDLVERSFPKDQREKLKMHESLTDFCYSGLRLRRGVCEISVRQKFGQQAERAFLEKTGRQIRFKNLEKKEGFYRLSQKGILMSNLVFSDFLFSESDIDKSEKSLLVIKNHRTLS